MQHLSLNLYHNSLEKEHLQSKYCTNNTFHFSFKWLIRIQSNQSNKITTTNIHNFKIIDRFFTFFEHFHLQKLFHFNIFVFINHFIISKRLKEVNRKLTLLIYIWTTNIFSRTTFPLSPLVSLWVFGLVV